MACAHLTGAIVGLSILAKCMLSPEPAIAKFLLKGEFVGVSIFWVKVILGLYTISHNRYLQPFSLPPIIFLLCWVFIPVIIGEEVSAPVF